jgi:hypothetical protein
MANSSTMQALLRSSQNTLSASILPMATFGTPSGEGRPRTAAQERNRVLDRRNTEAASTYQVKPTCWKGAAPSAWAIR